MKSVIVGALIGVIGSIVAAVLAVYVDHSLQGVPNPVDEGQMVCDVFLDGAFQAPVIAPRSWTVADCVDFSVAVLDAKGKEALFASKNYQVKLGCVYPDSKSFGDAVPIGQVPPKPSPNCGWR